MEEEVYIHNDNYKDKNAWERITLKKFATLWKNKKEYLNQFTFFDKIHMKFFKYMFKAIYFKYCFSCIL